MSSDAAKPVTHMAVVQTGGVNMMTFPAVEACRAELRQAGHQRAQADCCAQADYCAQAANSNSRAATRNSCAAGQRQRYATDTLLRRYDRERAGSSAPQRQRGE